jgi:hypothetical protein
MIHTQEQQQPDSGAVRSLSIFCLEKVCYIPWKGEQATQQVCKATFFFHGETTPTSLSTCESSSLRWCRKHSYVTASSFLYRVLLYRARFFFFSLSWLHREKRVSTVWNTKYLPFLFFHYHLWIERPPFNSVIDEQASYYHHIIIPSEKNYWIYYSHQTQTGFFFWKNKQNNQFIIYKMKTTRFYARRSLISLRRDFFWVFFFSRR